jgi:small GTP-binding protein
MPHKLTRLVLFPALIFGTLGATNAFFSDIETSAGNQFIAGAIDLTVTGQSAALPFKYLDLKPGDTGVNSLSLQVDNNDAWVCAEIFNLRSDDNLCTEPESLVDTTCGEEQGELQHYLFFTVWRDVDCNQVLDPGETVLIADQTLSAGIWPIADSSQGGPLPGSQATCLGISWQIPQESGNLIQTDSLSGDLIFTAIQGRHQPNFTCSPTTSLSPTPSLTPTNTPTPTFTPPPAGPTPSPTGTLFFSEYIEGSSFNKALEIFNPTDSTVNLTSYQLLIYANENTNPTTTINLIGNIASLNTHVICHPSFENLALCQQTGSLTFNGNDAVANIAVIAHVDHGKTTLVDALLKQTHVFRDNQAEMTEDCILDSNELERERGITIMAKTCAIEYQGTKINIIDTPGHADFSGEIERTLSMADGALLIIDAQEGPMPQTRFVLKKALELNLKMIVVVNKLDKKHADPQGALKRVENLFLELAHTDEHLNFPILYAIGKSGIVLDSLPETLPEEGSVEPLLKTIMAKIPAPQNVQLGNFKMLVSALDYDSHLGQMVIGKIHQGTLSPGQTVINVG